MSAKFLFKSNNLALIAGPKAEEKLPLDSQSLHEFEKYDANELIQFFSSLEHVKILQAGNENWYEWLWEWRVRQRYIRINFTLFDESPPIWGGSNLEISCFFSDLLSFWSTKISNAVQKWTNKKLEIPDYRKLSRPFRKFQEFLCIAIEELGGTKIVFMIDEYDLLDDLIQNKEIDDEVLDLLEWMIKNERVELVMAGRLPTESLKVENWKKITRTFVQIKLLPLDKESAKRLIIEPTETYLEYDESAIERILRLTNNHPYIIQLCCHVLVNYHNSKRNTIIKYDDVEENIPDMIELGSPGLSAMILTDATDEDKVVLRVMAKFLRVQTSISEQELIAKIRERNPQIDGRNIINSLSNLGKREVVRSVTEKEMRNYKFSCDIFRYWIEAKMEYMDRYILPLGTAEKIT